MKASVDDQSSVSARRLNDARRIVVKIGSSLLINEDTGELNRVWLESLAGELSELMANGQEVILVSSGAIALGRAYLNMQHDQRRLDEHQAAAAAGQVILAHGYQELMGAHDIKVAQVLLTRDDAEDRRRYLNARSTLETLMGLGVLPVINENDTVTTQEIRYGDNDRLAARVAEMVSADCLVLLSDVDGLYTADPSDDASAELIPEVLEITPELDAVAGESRTAYGTGGMATKLAAARICMSAGCATLIANGHQLRPLAVVRAGSDCTWFLSDKTPLAARKQWIAGMLIPAGQITIDAGAEEVLHNGGSLLSVGAKSVDGQFERGDAVIIAAMDGRAIAHGLTAYSSAEAATIMGAKSQEIEQKLGYQGSDELIHRDNLVLLE